MSKYPPRLKQQAMGMYAVGEALTDIADRLGIHRRTVGSWYESKIPADWEAERQVGRAAQVERAAIAGQAIQAQPQVDSQALPEDRAARFTPVDLSEIILQLPEALKVPAPLEAFLLWQALAEQAGRAARVEAIQQPALQALRSPVPPISAVEAV